LKQVKPTSHINGLEVHIEALNTNMTWLFTWYDNYELNIPNTTNMIDGHFSDLKNKLRNHNGLTKERKIKFIKEFLRTKIN
jgi:hypothetical protein